MKPEDLPKIADPATAARLFRSMAEAADSDEIAIVRNPAHVARPYEFYALAPKRDHVDELDAVLCDMDGTLTSTEALCLHSLEYLIRQITGRTDPAAWPGLDRERDWPEVIGNSNTRTIEYLLEAYREAIQPDAFERAFREAVDWTLSAGRETDRAEEAALDARTLEGGERLRRARFDEMVRAALDIYYARYHAILGAIKRGDREQIAELIDGGRGPLVVAMPGVAAFIALLKGWLGVEARTLAGAVVGSAEDAGILADLGDHFQRRPAKLGVVTASIRYEAEIILGELLHTLREEVADWPLAEDRRAALADRFAGPSAVFDATVTASDSSEIRLKPHPDLYALALYQLGVPPERYGNVVGLEDSESGVISIRAAGIGACCAVPFAATAAHDFSAASVVVHDGLPEVILSKRLFLAK